MLAAPRTAVDDIAANSGRAGTNNVVTPITSFIAASSYSRMQSVEFLTRISLARTAVAWDGRLPSLTATRTVT